MKLHYKGKYKGDEKELPQRKHPKGYVAFVEPDSVQKFTMIANLLSIIVLLAFGIPYFVFHKGGIMEHPFISFIAMMATMLTLLPHEILHALWYKDDVYIFDNLKQGSMFVVGTEDMSKLRFILMSLCPNVVFGLIPYILGWIFPQYYFLGVFGAICLSMGMGDYINVYNAIKQMPKGAKTYLSGFHSYWYIDNKNNK